jgi:hypothetical protein
MTHFTLAQRSVNKAQAKFHVIDERDGSIIGSISVKPNEASDLCKHWHGSTNTGEKRQAGPIANARRPPIGRMTRAAILRGC